MKLLPAILFLFCTSIYTFGQINSHDRWWYFAKDGGMDFSTGTPTVVVNGAADDVEGNVTATDRHGNLLFYGGGTKIYNSNHEVMLNATNVGGASAIQGPEVVQIAGTRNKYYYISQSGMSGPSYYTIVDMDLDGGLGGVDILNNRVKIRDNNDESMLVIPKKNNSCEHWLITHYQNEFFVDEVSGSGIKLNTPQVIGDIPPSNFAHLSYSPVTNKLALVVNFTLGLFDFDPVTGSVSNYVPITIPDYTFPGVGYYSSAFSPDGTWFASTTTDHSTSCQGGDLGPGYILISDLQGLLAGNR